MMKQFSICILFAILLCSYVFAQPGQWLTRAAMLTPRQEISPAVLNGKIYVPGGFGANAQATNVVEVYEPATNSWTPVAPLPEILHHYGLAAANGKLYLLGGYTGNTFNPMSRTYVYLPDSNVWRRKADMPVARGAHAAVEFNGKIYLFGGITNLGDSRRTDVYDPLTDTYTNLSPMPTAREHLAAARVDSLIYVVGGRIGATNNNVLEAYSPATNLWYTKASMPTARGGLAASAMYGRLYVCGGEIPGVYSQNEEYHPATNTWRTMLPMQTPRHGTGAVTVGDSIFVIGGAMQQGFGVSGVNELFHIPPEITLLRPAGGEILIAGSPDSVTWTATPQIDSVRLDYTFTGIWIPWIVGISAQPGILRYSVFANATTNGRFRVSWKQNPLIADFTDPPFTIRSSGPQFNVNTRLLDFGTLVISNCKNDSVKVKNVGNATLLISSIQSTNPRFSPTPTSAVISAGESLWVRVNYCADFPTGLQTSSLVFTHNSSSSRDTVSMRAIAWQFSGRWQVQTSGTTAFLYSVKAVNYLTGWTGGSRGTVLRTTNAGNTWTSVGGGSIGTADIYAVDAIDGNTAFATTSPAATFIHRTTNGGSTWTQVFTQSGGFINGMHMFDSNEGIAVGDPVGGRWTVAKTLNGGTTWTRTATEPPQIGTEAGWNNGISYAGDSLFWFSTNANRIYATRNRGASWNSISTPFSFSTFWFNNVNMGIGVGSSGAVRTTDGGSTWLPTAIPGTSTVVSSAGYGNCFWVAKGQVVYFSSDRGVSWELSFTGGIGSITHINMTPSFGTVAGWTVSAIGGIAYHQPIIDLAVGDNKEKANGYLLLRNYPNPFNPSTTIEYELPRASFVKLSVFNVLGEEMRLLVNEEQDAGTHQLKFDADGLPSGIYFYRIQTRDFNQSRKMIFLK